MIIRIFRVTVHDGKRAEFEDFFRNTAIPLVRSQPGIISVAAGVPRPESPNEFCMIMVWKDVDSLKAFAGEDWREPHIHPDEAALVHDRSLHHYELAEA
ncbi:antibiotic biosynthesis monooxygenase [Rhizobiales bacterium]|uniref:antibiotic biosynthesis monooxygenase family protein n=1 Tax=Hongsoonwoonella zoysiae TaxID=2821844 RepID=UPI00155F881D|nr:antibiotic biosynthesis monooxygenase family protein [Hongsoonwoonella zoysiae]NRG16191.1 antibiotic biosynthesis monooxygenase [Hongsoonwoonella zoysiae]